MGSSRHQVNPVKLSQLALAYSCSARSHARGVLPCYSRQTYCTPYPRSCSWAGQIVLDSGNPCYRRNGPPIIASGSIT
jgi:hypothetical protein